MKKTAKPQETAFDQVQRFYQFMNSNKLEVIEFSKDNTYIKLVRKHSTAVHQIPVFAPSAHAPAAKSAPANAQAPAHSGETIKAPMSGIFYRAPTPSSPPYVREGDAIKEGQVICIIEAMKVFNEIKAEANCVIEKVLLENGKLVEPNAPLFLVKN
ncbi:MAG TPA: hypothetical protein PKI19_09200 [Elusimicrobiales bacterium]|nr:hypothetical protein [Elusimicrobiales bacterium]